MDSLLFPYFLLGFTLLLPFLGALLTGLLHHKTTLQDRVPFITSLVVLVHLIAILFFTQKIPRLLLPLIPLVPQASFSFAVEPIGLSFSLVLAALWSMTSLFNLGYLPFHQEMHHCRFHIFMCSTIGAALGVAFAANLVTTFFCYSLLVLCGYPLVIHKGSQDAFHGGILYLATCVGAALTFLLPAIVTLAHEVGHTTFLLQGLVQSIPYHLTGAIFTLTVLGCAAIIFIPAKRWSNIATAAPTSASLLLFGFAVLPAGLLILIKSLLYIFDSYSLTQAQLLPFNGQSVLRILIMMSLLYTGYRALHTDHLQKRLIFLAIQDLAIITLLCFLFTKVMIISALLLLLVHGFAITVLLGAAGTIITHTHRTRITQLDGIGHVMPWTMAAFTLSALCFTHLPPFAGFSSIFLAFKESWSQMSFATIGVIIVGLLLRLAALVGLLYHAYFKRWLTENTLSSPEASQPIRIALLGTTLLGLTFSIAWYEMVPWILSRV